MLNISSTIKTKILYIESRNASESKHQHMGKIQEKH